MTSRQTHVIVGAGLAGAKAAETLREEGFDGRVVLIGAEEERPYERPPLSKDYLRGEVGREKVYVHDEGFYAEHDIELRLGRTAVSLDTASSVLQLDDGERLRYDRLLLATGAEPRRLSIPGAELDGVLYLRSVHDSDTLRERLDRGGRLVVVMEYSGFARAWDRVVFRGDPATREFVAFWLTGARVVAGMSVNVWDVTDPIKRLISQRVAVDDRTLSDADVSLEELGRVENGSVA